MKLRIAQVAPIAERVPPRKYGGTERVVWTLTEELVKKGHDVTLFASGDSITSARLSSVFPRSLRDAKILNPYGLNHHLLLHMLDAFRRQNEFDIIHDHNGIYSLPTIALSKTPVLATIHGSINSNNRAIYESAVNVNFVGISRAQLAPFPAIKSMGTVYNGLNMENYPFSNHPSDFLLYAGRICYEKGTHTAIDVANYLNIPLVIAAKLDDFNKDYFDEYIKPRLNSELIRYVGEVDEKTRNALMSQAKALLHPITWREPFGLTMIEAMSTGCPVIAFNKGSIPEVVEDGKTGFVVEDEEQMIEAVRKIKTIDRDYCREYALSKFSGQRMAENYENMYNRILSRHQLLENYLVSDRLW